MDVGSAINQGLIGMQRSQLSINQSAQQIASAAIEGPKASPQVLVENMVNLKVQENLFDANAKVIKTANDTLGSLLDVRA
jgi:flagellar hook-associated protein FlgK